MPPINPKTPEKAEIKPDPIDPRYPASVFCKLKNMTKLNTAIFLKLAASSGKIGSFKTVSEWEALRIQFYGK